MSFKEEIESNIIKFINKFKTKLIDIKIEKLSKLSKNIKIGICTGILGVAVVSTALFINMGTDVYKLNIDGENVGYISEPGIVEITIEEIKAELSERTDGVEILIDNEALVYEATDLKEKEVTFLSSEDLKDKILAAELLKAKAWAVNVNGKTVVATSSEKGAESILADVKSYYKSEGSEVVSASFKEEVFVTQAAVNVADIMKPADAVTLIVTGSKEPKTYIVQDGDTLWDIASINGMSPAELETANKGFDPEKLKIGQQLNLFEVKPYVTVEMKELVSATEKIDFKTVYETTNSLYKGEIKVKTAGVYGTKEIKTEVTKQNGIIVATNVVGTVVTSEPQNQIAIKGTKSLSTFTGSGVLSRPFGNIDVSSAFGSRGGGRHTGVDLRNPKGTPIKAADDGVVTFAGYKGTYGNLIKLSHGNGLETWYSHEDTIGVSVGQVVSKGEVIGTVGMTGRATGYHLHFEVRKNGIPQNPMNYL